MEKADAPNQIMRIAERFGIYDRERLNMEAPVYGSLAEWVQSFAPEAPQGDAETSDGIEPELQEEGNRNG